MTPKPLSAAARTALARAFPEEAQRKPTGFMRVQAVGADTVELLIYGDIGASWWDDTSVTAADVIKQLQGLTPKAINVRISSNGGSVSDGFAIHNELRRQAKAGVAVNVSVDSVAYSIASLIAMAGDTIAMYPNSLMMLHAPSVGLYFEGNRKQLTEVHDELLGWLTSYEQGMSSGYARKTGKPADDFQAMWDAGTDFKFSAQEALDFGLCDEVLADPADESAPDDAEEANAALLAALAAKAAPELRTALRAAFRVAPTPSQAANASATQAAPSAATLQEDTAMPNPNNPADNHAADPNPTAIATATAAAIAALRTRNTDIKALAEPHLGNPDVRAYYDQVIAEANPEVTAADVGAKILAMLGKGREPLNGNARVTAGTDEFDKQRGAMVNAIQARAGTGKIEQGNPYAGFSLMEMARASLDRLGVDTRGRDRLEVVGLAFTHSSSDFPNLLGDAARKSLMKGYEEVAYNLDLISRAVSVPDFNPRTLVGLGAFSDLDIVRENAEYKYGTFSENAAPIQLATYGKLFSISRQAIINDDMSLFSDVPRKMGQAARRTVAKALFNLLTSNPTLADGVALFHATHKNLLTGAAISTASVDAMRVAMATQTSPDGNALGLALKTLVTPVALGGLARTVQKAQFAVDASAKNNTQPNIVQNTFEVVDSALLDAASASVWYGIADPSQVDGLVIAYLDGKQEPYMEQHEGFTVDGVAWKVRLDAAPAVADYRGLAKNPGA